MFWGEKRGKIKHCEVVRLFGVKTALNDLILQRNNKTALIKGERMFTDIGEGGGTTKFLIVFVNSTDEGFLQKKKGRWGKGSRLRRKIFL